MEEPANLIVLRYQRVTYHGLSGVEAHGKRLGGDLEHVDPSRSDLNEYPVGHEHLREIANAHIVRMQKDNADRKAAGLRRSRHKTQARELEEAIEVAGDDPHALAEIIGWPWDPKNVTPFTEGIISVSHDWFLGDDGSEDPAKIDTFRDFVMGYLEEEFGNEVLYARFDRDEKTPHISFIVAPEHMNKRTKRRELSHHQHRLFGMKEVQALFDDEEPDPKLTRRSYEILQDRIADFAQRQGLDIQRGERRAAKERMQRTVGETVCKRKNISPARGRELAAMEAEAAAHDREMAAKETAAATEERQAAAQARVEAEEARTDARARQQAADKAQREAESARAALAAKEESLRVGAQAVISEELTYAPASAERPEGLTWGRNKPKSHKRRDWLMEKIRPARDWLVSFARSVFGFQKQRDAVLAEQQARAAAIIDFELKQKHVAPQSMLDIVNLDEAGPDGELRPIPRAWAVPAGMTAERLDVHLRGLTNTDICDAFAPTRDAAEFAEHDDIQARYRAGQRHLAREATRRGLDIELREHHPGKATDAGRALLHTDSPPGALHVIRTDHARERRRGS